MRKTSAWSSVWACIFAIVLFLLFFGCSKQSSQETAKQSPQETKEEPAPETKVQQESVTFPELGVVKITAEAEDIEGKLPKLVIHDAHKKVLFRLEMGHSDDNFLDGCSSIEFKVRHIPGLPDPLLMVVASACGGSYGRLEVALIGIVSGELKLLWNKYAYDRGGFFVGDLGKNRGIGTAQWFWSSTECNACDIDRYHIELYLWNEEKTRFDFDSKFIIKEDRFDDLKKLGLEFPNHIGWFTGDEGR